MIQGIARQTAESASSTPEFLSRFNGRIFSLSRAHDVLTDADWRGARIFDLVRSQIALYAEDRLASVIMEGENGFLRPNAAQYVGLALHELTTNALKYGALSRDDGMIVVRFETSPASPAALSLLLAGDEQRRDARAERPQFRPADADRGRADLGQRRGGADLPAGRASATSSISRRRSSSPERPQPRDRGAPVDKLVAPFVPAALGGAGARSLQGESIMRGLAHPRDDRRPDRDDRLRLDRPRNAAAHPAPFRMRPRAASS